MIISLIAALAQNRVIGKNNQLPWHLPADFKHFQDITNGHPVIMGQKTYESIGKPLPNRKNIVVTRDGAFGAPGCVIVYSLDEALKTAEGIEEDEEVFFIGGASVYQQVVPLCDRMYLTFIRASVEGDAYFPTYDSTEWKEVSREDHKADSKNQYAYSFVTLERRNP